MELLHESLLQSNSTPKPCTIFVSNSRIDIMKVSFMLYTSLKPPPPANWFRLAEQQGLRMLQFHLNKDIRNMYCSSHWQFEIKLQLPLGAQCKNDLSSSINAILQVLLHSWRNTVSRKTLPLFSRFTWGCGKSTKDYPSPPLPEIGKLSTIKILKDDLNS